ncbi:hypothetical protein [Streptomyces atratus]|uniref:Uncharacterized protein n=1 Tax=Streptomyces atratus TaxID=1893 RepID=A0A2Z5JNW0_STRAR|nr:hypothetical protein [Streptomyces atratus]AXE82126.1 hypothetical protein C5746_40470 [Streptomyces atratus]
MMRWEVLLVAATGLLLGAGIAWTTLIPLTRGLMGAAPHTPAGAATALVAGTVLLGIAATGLPTRALLGRPGHVRPGEEAVLRAGFVGVHEQAVTDSSAWTNSGA